MINTVWHTPNGNRTYYLSPQPAAVFRGDGPVAARATTTPALPYLDAMKGTRFDGWRGYAGDRARVPARRALSEVSILNRTTLTGHAPRSFRPDLRLVKRCPNRCGRFIAIARDASGWDFRAAGCGSQGPAPLETIDLIPSTSTLSIMPSARSPVCGRSGMSKRRGRPPVQLKTMRRKRFGDVFDPRKLHFRSPLAHR
jgi:hypothetical protein